MKTIIAVGRIVRGGAVEITAPTLEERVDAQIERNAERLAMNADLLAMLNGKPPAYKLTAAMLEEIENENIGQEIGQSPWRW